MFNVEQLQNNTQVLIRGLGKRYISAIDRTGKDNNNPFKRLAVYVTKEQGSGEGDWIVPERIIKMINQKQDKSPKFWNQELNAWNNRTKQGINEELISFKEIIDCIQNVF